MAGISIVTLIMLLYLIVAIIRFLIYKRQKPFLYYFANIRVNIAFACLMFWLFLTIYSGIFSLESFNYLLSLDWLHK